MRVNSKLGTKVAYDGGREWKENPRNPKHRVVLVPGVNELSELDERLLSVDEQFKRAYAGGYVTVETVADDGQQPAPPPDAPPPPAPVANPRDKLPGEKPAAYKTRMAALDEAEAQATRNASFLATFNAMTPDEQAAMLPTLSDEEKALVEGQKKDATDE